MEPQIDGAEIRQWRKEKGLSREEVGELCNVSASTVHNWESGRNKPHGKAAETIARLLAGEISVTPLTPLEERLLDELQAKHGFKNREDLLKKLVLDAIGESPSPKKGK